MNFGKHLIRFLKVMVSVTFRGYGYEYLAGLVVS